MDNQVAQETPAATRRRLRSIWWTHPPRVKWPEPTETAVARVKRAISTPHSREYAALFDDAPIAGGGVRRRRKRSDGAINTGAFLCSAIAAADLGNGLIAKPIGNVWQRKTWEDLGSLAFGQPVEGALSERRTERCAAELVKLGLIRITQWRKLQQDGQYRSEPGIKQITDKCWRMLGVYSLVQRERRRRDRERKIKQAASIASLLPQAPKGSRGRPGRPAGTVANPLRAVPVPKPYVRPPPDPPDPNQADKPPIDLEALFAETRAKLGLP